MWTLFFYRKQSSVGCLLLFRNRFIPKVRSFGKDKAKKSEVRFRWWARRNVYLRQIEGFFWITPCTLFFFRSFVQFRNGVDRNFDQLFMLTGAFRLDTSSPFASMKGHAPNRLLAIGLPSATLYGFDPGGGGSSKVPTSVRVRFSTLAASVFRPYFRAKSSYRQPHDTKTPLPFGTLVRAGKQGSLFRTAEGFAQL